MSQKIKEITRGGQITFHNFRMFVQINKTISLLFIFIFLIGIIPFWYWIVDNGITLFFAKFVIAKLFSILPAFLANSLLSSHTWVIVPLKPPVAVESAWKAYLNPDFHLFIKQFIQQMGMAFIGALLVSFLVTSAFVSWLSKRGRLQTENQFLRGAQLSTSEEVKKLITSKKINSDIVIDGLPFIKNAEVQHILVHGTTGTGKGQCISKILDSIRKRGDRVIIYDKGCSFTQYYYRKEKDIILNPFDERCVNWDLWQEGLDVPDFENMAESLIPMHGEQDPFWVNAARTIFSNVAFKMKNDPDRSISKLVKLILTSELEELEEYLKGTEAATLVSGKIEKTAISIRSILTSYLASLTSLYGLEGEKSNKRRPFSIRDWVQNENNGNDNWLFITSNTQQHITVRPLISMWLAMASIALLGLPENFNRRIWFIVDELPTLHKLPQLPETIAEVRKFGGCFLLGIQSSAQLEKIYNKNAGREIFDLLNTRFFFRSPSADMAKIAAQELGEEEVEDTRENYSYGANTIRDGISIGKQRSTRQLVTYSEIMQMEDLEYYLRLPTNLPIVKGKLKLELREKINRGFIKRNIPYTRLTENETDENDPNQNNSVSIAPNHILDKADVIEENKKRKKQKKSKNETHVLRDKLEQIIELGD